MGVRNAFSTRTGLFASIGLLVALAVFGGAHLQERVSNIQAEIPELEAGRLRDGVVALADLQRLTAALAEVDEAKPASVPARLVEALDFIHVRAETMARDFGVDGPEETSDATVAGLVQALRRIVAAGDVVVGAPEAGRLKELLEAVRAANGLLVRFINERQQTQNAAVQTQSDELLQMTYSSAALLVVFTVISGVAIALLRSEMVARIRQKEAERRAHFLAYFDPLTGLSNRTRFAEEIARISDGARASGAAGALILIDLDRFKQINDTHGHAFGDSYLQALAERIDAVAKSNGGLAARLGGDEFSLYAVSREGGRSKAALCEQLLDALRAPLRIGDVSLAPTASLGLAAAEQGESLGALMKRADLALYEVKRNGRDNYAIYDSELGKEHDKRQTLERGLTKAVTNEELFLVYQPQVNMADMTVLGYEALMRWRSPSGLISTDVFIGAAEQTGTIIDIDLWGLRTAALSLANLNCDAADGRKISVNLSPLHFQSDAIIHSVSDVIEEAGIDPNILTLEITENILIHDWSRIELLVRELKSIGVRIALDDFGTGFSSLSYLQHLPIDQVKVDRSFLLNLEESKKSRAIMAALVNLCDQIGIDLLVEGVETRSQMALLREMGCRYAQGFLFGQPDPYLLRAGLLTVPSVSPQSEGPDEPTAPPVKASSL